MNVSFFIEKFGPKTFLNELTTVPPSANKILKNSIEINAGTAHGKRYIDLNNTFPLILSLLRTIAKINPKAIAKVVAPIVQITVHPNILQNIAPTIP